MSDSATAEREHVVLEGIDLGGVPPCGMGYMSLVTGRRFPCGKPSVARIAARCPCSFGINAFTCKECLEDLKAGKVRCPKCLNPVTDWRET